MRFEETKIDGLIRVILEPVRDARGSFARVFCRDEFTKRGLPAEFVQASVSFTRFSGTVRGMHYQGGIHSEEKLVRCGRGAIFDVVVDLRPDSPTFRRWSSCELSPTCNVSLYVPAGCAHGLQTLQDDTEVIYQMTEPYAPSAATGFRYDDPEIGIVWAREVTRVSEQDLSWPQLPPLREFERLKRLAEGSGGT